MIDTRLIGPKDDQYAVLSLGTVWLATTKKPYAEAVSAAIAATIAGGGAADAAPSATAATQDAQAIVASCCAAFDCRPSELLGMIRDLKGGDMKGGKP